MSADARRVLFIANGNGEDSIAAAIIAKLPKTYQVDAYPVVGAGKAYEGLCNIVGPRAFVPSEGWRHTSGSVARDVRGGMLKSIKPSLHYLKSSRHQYEKVVAVGDAVTPLLCWLAGLKIDIYLDVFKSGYAHRYSAIEKFLLKGATRKTYCRDDMLAGALQKAGMNAVSAGNIMLDTVPYGTYDVAARRQHELMVTLLPGSRVWTGESLKLYVEALRALPDGMTPDVFVAVAGGVEPAELAAATGLTHQMPTEGEATDLGWLEGEGLKLHLARGAVGNLIAASDVVVSQAGTATQQALGMGKPVITYNRADNRKKRMDDEQALMGEARILTAPDPMAVAKALQNLLSNETERQRLGAIGAARLGGPGTLDRVVADLTA